MEVPRIFSGIYGMMLGIALGRIPSYYYVAGPWQMKTTTSRTTPPANAPALFQSQTLKQISSSWGRASQLKRRDRTLESGTTITLLLAREARIIDYSNDAILVDV
jgi:hypothetical protein